MAAPGRSIRRSPGTSTSSAGISADLIATLDGYSRETVDAYAVESQRRAAQAQQSGWFDRSIVAVTDWRR
jgi:acetyl-CoA C-acetyltransferase